MSSKTRSILFFVIATIITFSYTTQARYLLVEVDGVPKIDDTLPGVLPVNLTTNIPVSDDSSTTPEFTITMNSNNGTFRYTTPESGESDGDTSTTTLITPEINVEFKTTITESDDGPTTTFYYHN